MTGAPAMKIPVNDTFSRVLLSLVASVTYLLQVIVLMFSTVSFDLALILVERPRLSGPQALPGDSGIS